VPFDFFFQKGLGGQLAINKNKSLHMGPFQMGQAWGLCLLGGVVLNLFFF